MSQNHRRNTNFQIAYFLTGSRHTYDGMYAMLLDLKEEREAAIFNYLVVSKRNEASRKRLEWIVSTSKEETDRIMAEADLMELNYAEETGKVHYQAAQEELSFINKCIDKVQPLRKYKNLPDAEAHEATQQEEWKLELINRVENSLATVGFIPTDDFNTMRMHPEFKTAILPVIEKLTLQLQKGKGIRKELETEKITLLLED